jgi:hypothetical protein
MHGAWQQRGAAAPQLRMRNYQQHHGYTPPYEMYPFGIDFEGLPFYYVNKRRYDPRTAKPFPFVNLRKLRWYSRQPCRNVPTLDHFPGPLNRLRGHLGETKNKGTIRSGPISALHTYSAGSNEEFLCA